MVVKSGLRSDGHTRIWGLVLGGGAFFALAFAVVGVVFGVGFGENTIIAGPEVVVATPDTGDFSSAVGATSIAISRSESGFGRTVWNLATAAILAGIAAFLFGLSRVFLKANRSELFSSQSSQQLVVWSLGSFFLIVIGGIVRVVMEGRIIGASGLVEVDSPDDDFSLFIFEIPFVLLILVVQVVTWLWQRAASIESDLEEVV